METKTIDVTALGELLIDFVQSGTGPQGNPLFEANPGGAPANVLAMLAKLGRRCSFLGKVGQDAFGDQLEKTLEDLKIDTEGLKRDPFIPTTLAVVHTLPGGDRDFSFYRKPGADLMLRPEELAEEKLLGCRIFHFGTLSLTDEPCRSATKQALMLARRAGALISFDPNLRPPLWESAEAAREQIAWGLAQADVVKISDNEVSFMTGTKDCPAGAALLKERFPNIRLLNLTMGAEGSQAFYDGYSVFEPALHRGGVIETSGAGDTFGALVLQFVLEHGLEGLTEADLHSMLKTANTAAYLVTTKKGVIPSLPREEEIQRLLCQEEN
ncbi:MAG: carbohydrate kinase [Lachnospiraceae bacterium]|nr:carbohydrate kinase [Lachnospiraceae bacterium]